VRNDPDRRAGRWFVAQRSDSGVACRVGEDGRRYSPSTASRRFNSLFHANVDFRTLPHEYRVPLVILFVYQVMALAALLIVGVVAAIGWLAAILLGP
jgi:hypothetical protein